MNRETIIEELQKIKALADAGIDGEAHAAKCLLEVRLRKYGMTLEDLGEEKERDYFIKYGDAFDRKLMAQVGYMLGLSVYVVTKGSRKIKKGCITATPAQAANFMTILDTVRAAWKEEQENFYEAFVQSQKLFPPDEKADRNVELSEEETDRIRRILQMASNIDRREIYKRLEGE